MIDDRLCRAGHARSLERAVFWQIESARSTREPWRRSGRLAKRRRLRQTVQKCVYCFPHASPEKTCEGPPERACSSDEAAREDRDHRDPDMGRKEVGLAIEDDVEPAIAAEPGKQPFNGLITNDKFCLTRTGQLRLSWPRARGGLRDPGAPQLSGEITRRGEEHAAAATTHLARPARRRTDRDRPAALGSGLSAPPAVGDDPAGADQGAGIPDPAGGVPCA